MACYAHCEAADQLFSRQVAEETLRRYRRAGPDPTTRLLLAAVRETGLRDAELLDIGAGIGVLHHELLDSHVARATHVEAASGAIAVARAEAGRRGHGTRVQFLAGDFVALADAVSAADVVTLDRVICCYPDWEPLVRRSAEKAQSVYAFSIPRDRWYVRLVIWAENRWRRVTGSAFRAFVHPVAGVDDLLGTLGLRLRWSRTTVFWHVALYQRRRDLPPGH